MKPKYKQAHMKAAHLYAELSSATRLKVGALIVKDDRIISIGYNGMPSGWDNNCEHRVDKEMGESIYSVEQWEKMCEEFPLTEGDPQDKENFKMYAIRTRPEVLHAETNAIAKLARSSESGLGSTLFVTHSPCLDCAKIIYQSGIEHVYYATDYRDDRGITFLRDSGIQVEKLDV